MKILSVEWDFGQNRVTVHYIAHDSIVPEVVEYSNVGDKGRFDEILRSVLAGVIP